MIHCAHGTGYNPTAVKSVDEYANLDKEDESLARWKASLGILPGTASEDKSKPKVRTRVPCGQGCSMLTFVAF